MRLKRWFSEKLRAVTKGLHCAVRSISNPELHLQIQHLDPRTQWRQYSRHTCPPFAIAFTQACTSTARCSCMLSQLYLPLLISNKVWLQFERKLGRTATFLSFSISLLLASYAVYMVWITLSSLLFLIRFALQRKLHPVKQVELLFNSLNLGTLKKKKADLQVINIDY